MNLEKYLKIELSKKTKSDTKEMEKIEDRLLEQNRQSLPTTIDEATKIVPRCIRDFNDALSDHYDELNAGEAYLELRKSFLGLVSYILKKVEKYERGLVIDGGCATGIDLGFLSLKNPNLEFLGYDVSSWMARKAKERLKKWQVSNAEVIVADHDNLPLKDEIAELFYFDRSFGEEGKFLYNYAVSKREFKRAKRFARNLKRDGLLCLVYNSGHDTMYPITETKTFASLTGGYAGLKVEGIDNLWVSGNFLITLRKNG